MKILTLCTLCLFSYQAFSQEKIQLRSEFNIEDVVWVKTEGQSSVSGEAYIKLEDSKYKGCSGFNIELLPASKYADERILLTYGNNEQGQILMSENPPKFIPDVKAYHDYLIKSTCDSANTFSFNNVPEGDFYVIAFVIWNEKGTQQGGGIMKRISVGEEEHKKITIKK